MSEQKCIGDYNSMLPEIGKLTGESRPDQKYKRGIVQNGYESIS